MKTDQLSLAETGPLAVQDKQPTMLSLMSQAMQAGQDPAYLRELLAVRREWEEDEARKAFNVAMSEFQRWAPIIPKADKGDKSPFAKIDRIWRTIRPKLTELGLSLTWQICELRNADLCHIEGKVAHKLGHFEKITFDVPVSGLITSKEGRAVTNVSQMMGSAHSYAQRYATCSALGIITGEDDDGLKAGSQFITIEQTDELNEMIDACRGLAGWDEPKFIAWVKADSTQEILAVRYNDVKRFLSNKLKGTP